MIQGGGKLFAGSSGRVIGPGHFGLLDLGNGVQKFSLHYEADLDRGGASVLDIRPLLWRGWPIAGENAKKGTYEIESVRTGTSLELAVEGFPVGGPPVRRRPPNGDFFGGTGHVIPPQDVAEVSKKWPTGDVDVRLAIYLCQAQQKWTITPVKDRGGYPGSPFFEITIAGTERALMATRNAELATAEEFTGAPEQLWRLDELSDGTWRIMPKSVPGTADPEALSAVGSSSVTPATFDPQSEKQRWVLNTP